jgi:hypothetical protein
MKKSNSSFYTYAYLRENGTPYYIGKGQKNRAFTRHNNVKVPPPDRILILKRNLTEAEAFKHEKYMISVFGRKDLGTGILWNFTEGGEGTSGRVLSEETKRKMSISQKGRSVSAERRAKISNTLKGRKLSKTHKKAKQYGRRGEDHPMFGKVKEENPLYGVPRPEEVKSRIAKTLAGHEVTQETRDKISQKLKGIKTYVNCENKVVLRHAHPGEGWIPGRKWR